MSGRLIIRLAHWKEQKRLDGKKGVQSNHRRHPGRQREISVFLLTFLIMDVPSSFRCPERYRGYPACAFWGDCPNSHSLAVFLWRREWLFILLLIFTHENVCLINTCCFIWIVVANGTLSFLQRMFLQLCHIPSWSLPNSK